MNIRILQTMVSGIPPLFWALEPERRILMVLWSLGPLHYQVVGCTCSAPRIFKEGCGCPSRPFERRIDRPKLPCLELQSSKTKGYMVHHLGARMMDRVPFLFKEILGTLEIQVVSEYSSRKAILNRCVYSSLTYLFLDFFSPPRPSCCKDFGGTSPQDLASAVHR